MTELESHPPMTVERVQTGDGSHIEPPFDEKWDKLTQLRWHAGVVLADCGVSVDIVTGSYQRKVPLFGYVTIPGVYSLSIGNTSHSAYNFEEAWTFLNGIEAGANAPKVEGDLADVVKLLDSFGDAVRSNGLTLDEIDGRQGG